MKQKAFKRPEAASADPEEQLSNYIGLWSEPFSSNYFATVASVIKLSVTDHRKTPVH